MLENVTTNVAGRKIIITTMIPRMSSLSLLVASAIVLLSWAPPESSEFW